MNIVILILLSLISLYTNESVDLSMRVPPRPRERGSNSRRLNEKC